MKAVENLPLKWKEFQNLSEAVADGGCGGPLVTSSAQRTSSSTQPRPPGLSLLPVCSGEVPEFLGQSSLQTFSPIDHQVFTPTCQTLGPIFSFRKYGHRSSASSYLNLPEERALAALPLSCCDGFLLPT